MIPKILHFIWIGQKPKFLNNVISEYRKLNPTFSINVISYTETQLANLFFNNLQKTEIDRICYELLNSILLGNRYETLIKQQVIQLNKTSNNVYFILLFCDILRLELLNIYGGIYLDCDTYPIRQFDNSILLHKKFIVYDKLNEYSFYPNNYFIGSEKNLSWKNYFDGTADKIILYNNKQLTHMNKEKGFDYHIRRIKFFNCTISGNDMKCLTTNVDYFEHYSEFRWGRHKITYTKFDNIFDKTKYLKSAY